MEKAYSDDDDDYVQGKSHLPNAGPPKMGKTGLKVAYVQNLLNARTGPPPLWVDGIFGPKTDARVKQFQATRGLAVDGIVGPMTLGALEAGPPPIKRRPPAGPGGQVVVPAVGGV